MTKLMLVSATAIGLFATSVLAAPAPNPDSKQGCVAVATLNFKVDNSGGDKTMSTGEAISARQKDGSYNKDYTRGDDVKALNALCNGPVPD